MRASRVRAVTIAVVAAALVATACSSKSSTSGGAGGVALTGAGATFPDPIYEQWFDDFQQVMPGAKINYQAIGSGGGVEQFTAQTVDFGASDAPLQSDEISALPGPYIEIPTVLGGVVIAYNVAGLKSGLKLDGETASKIFQGEITTWDDPAIAKLNPGVSLPSTPISVVHRSDESGTTFVFTSWLSSQSKDWESKVGADKAVNWPTGTGGDGNDGVAAAISQTDGSVGYLSYDFAVTSKLGIADIKAQDGSYITPSIESISKAGGGLTFPISPDTNILNSTTKGAYPISSTTYLLLYEQATDQAKAQTLFDFVTWALTTGQGTVQKLNYSPLPSDIASQALDALGKMTVNGQSLTASSAVTGGSTGSSSG
ncbi:MAG TPA: phosphate ABC transporter substrate-binding protein PstS [Actinomycetota bacterium]|nr:phosphate ABC transporter substrate-binding protein PstS [Actinomycetota bacterium]